MYKRLNITLPEDVVRRADSYAEENRYTRSGLIAGALEAFIAGGRGRVSAVTDLAAEASALYATAEAPTLDRVAALLAAFFAGRDDVEAAWVFGSVVRGSNTVRSDVDVAVLPAARLDAEQRWALRVDLASRLPGALGVREVDVAIVQDLGAVARHRALVEGERVFGRHSRSAAEEELAAARAYAEFARFSHARNRRLTERLAGHGES